MPDLHDLVTDAAPRPTAPVDVDALWRTGRRRRTGRRALGAAGALVLLVAGLGTLAALTVPTVRFAAGGPDDAISEDDRDPVAEDPVAEEPVAEEPAAIDAPEPVRLGALLPLSGDLAMLGPGMQAAVELAVDDLNAAGGMLGRPVEVVVVDSTDGARDPDSAVGRDAVDELLAQDVTAVIGPVSGGGHTDQVVRQLADAGVLVLSPTASSADFGEGSDGLIGRLAAGNSLAGLALAEAIATDGATRVAVIARDDGYGLGAAAHLRDGLQAAGVEVTEELHYDERTMDAGALVAQAGASSPDAVVLLAFLEAGSLLAEMAAQGLGPDSVAVWTGDLHLVDGLPPDAVGLRGVRPAPLDDAAFVARLAAERPDVADPFAAAATYDAVITVALASATAGSEEPGEIAAALAGVTRPGSQPCHAVADCLELIGEGTAVTYDGAIGVADLGDANQPEGAAFEIYRVEADGSLPTIGTLEVDSR